MKAIKKPLQSGKRKSEDIYFPFVNNSSDIYYGDGFFHNNGVTNSITHSPELHQIKPHCEICKSDMIAYDQPFQCNHCRINICEACVIWGGRNLLDIWWVTDLCPKCKGVIGIERF